MVHWLLAASFAALAPSSHASEPEPQARAAPRVAVIDGSAHAEHLTVHLPGREPLELQRRAHAPLPTGGRTWCGHAPASSAGEAEATGAFVFGSGGELQRAVVRVDAAIWSLAPDARGVLGALDLSTRELPACGFDARSRIGAGSGQAPPFPAGAGQRTVVDVLVVYTPAARAGEGGVGAIETLIDLAAAEANLAYTLSGLELAARVVHTAETSYVESGNHFLDMQRLQQKQDGFMDEVFALRNTYGADCVMLVTDTLNTCGNGYLWNDPPNPAFKAFAFSVVSRHCAVQFLSFAHELGHNLGCDHDQASATPGGGAYGYSRGFLSPSNAWRSVMGLSSATRIPRFSDPNATFAGEALGIPTGQPGAADNVRSLATVAPLVATFREPVPQSIGTGMLTSTGTTVQLAASGSNDVGAQSFGLTVTGGVPNRPAVAFVGFEPGVIPFAGGTLFVTPPLQRLGMQVLDVMGETNYGALALPSFSAGQEAFFQTWTSDPAHPSGAGVALSNAVRVEFFD